MAVDQAAVDAALTTLETAPNDLLAGRTERIAALLEKARPRVGETLASADSAAGAGPATAAESSEAAALTRYEREYDHLPEDAKGRLTWDAVAAKLKANDGAKLKKAKAMQGGGHLFHITEGGDVLFKDRGVEPVMYGWDKPEGEEDRKLVQLYGRVPDWMATIKQWANAPEIEARVTADGYELFEDDSNYGFSEEMKRAASVNEGGLFVASNNRREWRDTILKNGRSAGFDPDAEIVFVDVFDPEDRDDVSGAVRLLRV